NVCSTPAFACRGLLRDVNLICSSSPTCCKRFSTTACIPTRAVGRIKPCSIFCVHLIRRVQHSSRTRGGPECCWMRAQTSQHEKISAVAHHSPLPRETTIPAWCDSCCRGAHQRIGRMTNPGRRRLPGQPARVTLRSCKSCATPALQPDSVRPYRADGHVNPLSRFQIRCGRTIGGLELRDGGHRCQSEDR